MDSTNHASRLLSRLILLTGFCIVSDGHVSEANLSTSCTFCRRDHVAVEFLPLVSVRDFFADRYNSAATLMPFVSKVSSEFKVIVCPFDNPASLELIPEAVAVWNAEIFNISNDAKMEVWMDVSTGSGSSNFTDILIRLQVSVYRANQIHPGTVTTLLLPSQMINGNTKDFHKVLIRLRRKFPQNALKLALGVELRDFHDRMKQRPGVLATQIANSFHLIDYIIFTGFFHHISAFSHSAEETVRPQLDIVLSCIRFVEQNAKTSLSFGVSGGLSDTSEDGLILYSRFVQNLKEFVNLGTFYNMTVIMVRAFDIPTNDKFTVMTSGWWRLIENGAYNSTAEYDFEDKQSMAERDKGNTPEALISQIEPEVQFDRQNVAVTFIPALPPPTGNREQQRHFNLSFVPLLLDTLGTKFSVVSLYRVDMIWRLLTPVWFAKYNIHAKVALNVIYTQALSDEHELDFTVNKIAEANQLFPSTVTKVRLAPAREVTSASVVHLRKRLNPNPSASLITVGILMQAEICSVGDQFLLTEGLVPALGTVDFAHFIYIQGSPRSISYKFGVDRVVSQVIALFEICKRRMEIAYPEIEVAFETGFPDTLKSREEDYVSLVLFWKEISGWATRTNTNVIMSAAFDAIYETDEDAIHSSMGWWKISGSGKSNDQLVIQEKRQIVVDRYRRATGEPGNIPEGDNIIAQISISVSAVFAALIVVSILIYKCKYSGLQGNKGISYAAQLQLNRDDIFILPHTSFNPESSILIGTGNFGTVYKCYMSQFQSNVAVKTISASCQVDEFEKSTATKYLLSEIKIMSDVGHHENILQILGVCQEESLFLVTEYCVNGSLLSYLRSESLNDTVPSMYELLQFCMEIANGMDYLEQRKVIHGDLAARNVLLDATRRCKISDFGLSRKLEQYEKYMKQGEEPLPWRWMALESLEEMEFSAKSDVWSMAVTFWEVFSLGKTPFPELVWNEEFCTKLSAGLRLEKPTLCSDEFFQILLSCWQIDCKKQSKASDVLNGILELKRSEYEKL